MKILLSFHYDENSFMLHGSWNFPNGLIHAALSQYSKQYDNRPFITISITSAAIFLFKVN